ncbi:MAG: L,D-transpeptidase [Legionellaceae bacterium]|nr:L,D-transpeptidase [Legionellaceae bacterium]
MVDAPKSKQLVVISIRKQLLYAYSGGDLWATFPISSAKNGLGEQEGSEQTPRGWFKVMQIYGRDAPINSIWVERRWTGEIYAPTLQEEYPGRDFILTRIIQLQGLEQGRNLGGTVDTLNRHIYIHGTSDESYIGVPRSHGCIRMLNADVVLLADWISGETKLCLELF